MNENDKRSFLLYFDTYPSVAALPADQRGELLLALFEYAMAAAEGEDGMDAVLDRHPAMGPDTRMALLFMSGTIRRDTDKWRARHRRCQAAARRRHRAAGGAFADDAWAYVDAAEPAREEEKSPPDGEAFQ